MRSLTIRLVAAAVLACALPALPAQAAGPEPGSPEFSERDMGNMNAAYGRQNAPDGQVNNPAYLSALLAGGVPQGLEQLVEQAAAPNRPSITPGVYFPGWNRGNPFRDRWSGRRGQSIRVQWTNRYGALIRGTVYAPLPGARDPYTGRRLRPPYPGAVITTGSIQGSERMYQWLAQDLAERGYVALTYDVQGQGTSETLPHEGQEINALPFCNPFAEPKAGEMMGCPGVPSQQTANFVTGTVDAMTFFLSHPGDRYANPASSDVKVNEFNPFWKLFDRSKDRRSATPGRRTRLAIIGHSLGASAVSQVQATDRRAQVVVALDKLNPGDAKPAIPALAVQSEYGFTVNPYFLNNGSSLTPRPGPPSQGPDPKRELGTGFETWRKAGVDAMLIVPRASTHLEYTDIPLAMPASRYGQALTSVYIQAFLDRYLRHNETKDLLATRFRYLEPVSLDEWKPVTLERADHLSFYHCSAYSMKKPRTRKNRRIETLDIAGVGGC